MKLRIPIALLVIIIALTLWFTRAGAQTFQSSVVNGEPSVDQERSVTVSNVFYVVKYRLKSTSLYSVPLTNPLGQAHYGCTATIYGGTNKVGVIETQWTKEGCFEDSPMLLLGRVLAWTRYPNESAGKGLHWVVSGPAMWVEPDANPSP